jgi:hypothetical protein
MPNNTSVFTPVLARLGALALIYAGTTNLLTNAAANDVSLAALSGTWRGDGTMSFESGQTESISCNGYYKGVGHLSVVLRCKGPSSNFELRSRLQSDGDKVSGSWEERTYNATGSVSGTTSPGRLNVQFSGTLIGNLEMSFSPSTQSVSVSVGTKGAGIKDVRVGLTRM